MDEEVLEATNELIKRLETLYGLECKIDKCSMLGKSLHVKTKDDRYFTFAMSDDAEAMEKMICSFADVGPIN